MTNKVIGVILLMQKIREQLLCLKKAQKVAIIVFTICFLLCSFMISKLNLINHSSKNDGTKQYASEYFEIDKVDNLNTTTKLNPDDIKWDNSSVTLKDKDIINILLIGQDRRPGEGRARSDSMIIATLNKRDDSIKLTSLMRDMYVQIPGFSDNKINAAYSIGGMKLLDDTIEKNFAVQIDGNIEVDFEGFTKIIDKIGGVDININKADANYLNTYTNTKIRAGTCHMSGTTALEYSRIRYVGNGDYERTERQRKVLLAAFEKLKDSNLTTLISLSDEIFPMITTDLFNAKIIEYIKDVMTMDISEIETLRIPADGKFTAARIREMSVLVPDLTLNRKILKEFICNDMN